MFPEINFEEDLLSKTSFDCETLSDLKWDIYIYDDLEKSFQKKNPKIIK